MIRSLTHSRTAVVLITLTALSIPGFSSLWSEDAGGAYIDENTILRKMEIEIGEKINPLRREAAQTETESQENEKQKHEAQNHNYKVRLQLSGSDFVEGEVVLSQKMVELRSGEEGNARRFQIELKKIRSIEFQEWSVRTRKSTEKGESKLYFMPRKCQVVTLDGKSYQGYFQNMDWLQLDLSRSSTSESYRTYFTRISRKVSDKSAKKSGSAESAETASSDQKGKGSVMGKNDIPERTVVGVEFYETDALRAKQDTALGPDL